MRILIYTANYAPEPTGTGKYSGEMAAWLAAQGHDVRVVAAPPYDPNWKLGAGYAWPPYRRERLEGVDVWRAPLWVPRRPGGLMRIIHLMSFAASSLPVMLWQLLWRPQVVLTVAPAIVCAPMGWLTARLCGAGAWLHVQDFEVDVAFRMGLMKGRRLQGVVRGLERMLLRRFDVVSSISHKMLELLAQKGIPASRRSLFPNWVDVTHIQPLSAPSSYRKELGIADDAVVMMFSGSLGSKQDLLLIPEVARLLQHRKELVFVICGDGIMQPALAAAGAALPNFRMLPLQPFSRLSELLGLADIHLLTQSSDAEDLVLPSKLSGMLASGRPVLATCNPGTEIAALLERCGRRVAPGDANALAAAIEQLADAPELRQTLGTQARQCAQTRFAQQTVLEQLERELEQLHGDLRDEAPAGGGRLRG